MIQHGFKVIEMSDLPANSPQFSWRRVNVFDYTIETHPNCPIDGTPMETIAALVSLTLDEKIRCACCPRCGLVGYIDRPSQADIDRYYAETWMGETVERAIAISRHIDSSPPNENAIDVMMSLPIDNSLTVLEIGCGYGRTINELQYAGFENIDATEHCPARAEAVRQVFGVNVTTDIPQKRYGLIISHHVIEHVADPVGLIMACAERQERQDWMIHSMPNFSGEPSMGVLFFLPHLWSFDRLSSFSMFAKYGYVCKHDAISFETHLDRRTRFQVMQKCVQPNERDLWGVKSFVEDAIDKLLYGLGLTLQRSVLTWQKDSDGAAWKSMPYAQQAAANNFPRSIVVEPPSPFITDAPIEVQFPERVQMYVK